MILRPVSRRHPPRLGDRDARVAGLPPDDRIKEETQHDRDRIDELQERLYADERFALLVVLQGRDAAGKDGTIRKVFGRADPQGCEVTSFKVPTPKERAHDFLWRVHARVPERGMIGIFNRSHYEDVLVPRVKGGLSPRGAVGRLAQINDFERMLAANGVVILKFMLHVSRDEQRERLQERLADPSKNWKFNPGDLDARRQWDAYTRAYRLCLSHTSTRWAPWYVVPADDKDVRNWLIARTVADRMAALGLRFPRASAEVLRMKVR